MYLLAEVLNILNCLPDLWRLEMYKFYFFIIIAFIVIPIKASQSECYSNNCLNLISGNDYITSAQAIQSDYDLGIVKQLIECKCLDDFDEYKGLRIRLKKMVSTYESSNSGCNKIFCDDLINNSNAMYNYGSISQIRNEVDYDNAKKIVENCECWASTQGVQGSYYIDLFKKMRGMIKEYEQWLVEKNKQDEIDKNQEDERLKKEEETAKAKAEQDSIRKIEEPKKIAALLSKPGTIEECISKCKQYEDDFGEKPTVCSKDLVGKVKSLPLNKIMSQGIAEVYFTPKTELLNWYMEGKNTGYVQIGGDVSWVSGNLAEMNMGSDISFLVKFASPWVIREGMPFMGYGKPIGNITYTTSLGARRTLPCLQLIWLYRPSLDQ